MVRHKITTYAMLTPERRFQLQEDIRSRRAARVAAGMSPDSPGPEEIGEVEEAEDRRRHAHAFEFLVVSLSHILLLFIANYRQSYKKIFYLLSTAP